LIDGTGMPACRSAFAANGDRIASRLTVTFDRRTGVPGFGLAKDLFLDEVSRDR
jgi:hypothetical protein